jgi:O-antigen ligase
VIAWTAFAFGGVYPSTLLIPALLVVALTIAYRPILMSGSPTPSLDMALLAMLVAMVIQVVPMPRTLLTFFTPNAAAIASQLALADPGGALPMSLDLQDSAAAIALFGGCLLVFFSARQIFDGGGVRTLTRGVAVVGLVLAAIAIAQDATGGGLMYWRWKPTFERARPFGPFVNRNHYGTWAMLAVPLVIGYLTAHATAHHGFRSSATWQRRIVAALDGRAALLLVSAALMIVAVALSLSRSAFLGLGAALAMGGWLSHRRAVTDHHSHARPALLVAAIAVLAGVLIVVRVPPTDLVDRVSGVPVGLADRQTIWAETVPVLRDFWLTGTGVGTYQTSMAVYQRSHKGVIYNQAHNHYLQAAAEGGLLVGLPLVCALWLLLRDGAATLVRDKSGMYWLRAGAASGLTGVAVQSLLEGGLLTPANAVLAAVSAAIVVHVPGRYGPPRLR